MREARPAGRAEPLKGAGVLCAKKSSESNIGEGFSSRDGEGNGRGAVEATMRERGFPLIPGCFSAEVGIDSWLTLLPCWGIAPPLSGLNH